MTKSKYTYLKVCDDPNIKWEIVKPPKTKSRVFYIGDTVAEIKPSLVKQIKRKENG